MSKKDKFLALFREYYPVKEDMPWQYAKANAVKIYDIAKKVGMTGNYARVLARDYLAEEYGVSYESFLENSDKAYAIQAAKAVEKKMYGGEETMARRKKNQNEQNNQNQNNEQNNQKKVLKPSDMKIPDIQKLAEEGADIEDILTLYHAKETEFGNVLQRGFGNDEQGRKQLVDKLVENGEKKKKSTPKTTEQPAPAEIATESVPVAEEKAAEKPMTLEEMALEQASLKARLAELEKKLEQAKNADKDVRLFLDQAKTILDKAEKTLSDNKVLVDVIDDDQQEIKKNLAGLSELIEKAVKESKTVRLEVIPETREIVVLESQIEINYDGWEAIRNEIGEKNPEISFIQANLAAKVRAAKKNAEDYEFEIVCKDETIKKLI